MRDAFVSWQCRVRQIAVRRDQARPSKAMVPSITLSGSSSTSSPVAFDVITMLNKKDEYELTTEFRHIYRKTHDPQQRVETVLKLLGEYYYQRAHEFDDSLTASFSAQSRTAIQLEGNECVMHYRQYEQGFDVHCSVVKLDSDDYLYQATYWHNILFNQHLRADSIILAFRPDWSKSTALSGWS